jgi:hypothetical protein
VRKENGRTKILDLTRYKRYVKGCWPTHRKWHGFVSELVRRVKKINMSRLPVNVFALDNLTAWRTQYHVEGLMEVDDYISIVKILTGIKLDLMNQPDFRLFIISSIRIEHWWDFISTNILPILKKEPKIASENPDEAPCGILFPLEDRLIGIGNSWFRKWVEGKTRACGGKVPIEADKILEIVNIFSGDTNKKPFTRISQGFIEGFDMTTVSGCRVI